MVMLVIGSGQQVVSRKTNLVRLIAMRRDA
jgi:hypothetical protein